MAQKQDLNSAEGFVGSVFKFSISTFANIGILGASILLTSFLIDPDVYGEIDLFVGYTNTIMTIAILGLDQALIRFFAKPPKGLSQHGLFRVCFYLSSLVLLGAGTLGSTVLMLPLYNAIGFETLGYGIMPLLFLNAFFYMILRYFNVLYRMEMNIKVYTTESILMQFFYKLFYIFGIFLPFANPLPAMVACSMLGLGGFSLVFCFLRRSALVPRRSEFSRASYRALLPYGAAVAPTAVFVTLNSMIPKSIVDSATDKTTLGIYTFAYSLSNMVTMIQGGFASFWGAYMYENYETQQQRIMRVHDFLNLVILGFFSFLVAVEGIMFYILSIFKPDYYYSMRIFPLMMLGAVFTILCETTVYGNTIARKPILDTIGIGLSFLTNVLLCAVLVRGDGALIGAAAAVVSANLVMFLFRSFTAQRLYRSIPSIGRTAAAVLVAVGLAIAGTVFAYTPLVRVPLALGCIVFYCVLYRAQLGQLWRLAMGILKGLFKRAGA